MHFDYAVGPRSLYIHWPFCPYKCHFCNFVAIAAHEEYMAQYHDALCKEINSFFMQYALHQQIDTIFLGGGTPSTYPDSLLLDMFGKLKERVTIMPKAEVTIEVNPGTVRKEQISLWQEIGISRVSIGVQSLNELVLKKLNRHQSTYDVYAVMDMLQNQFNISVDLIIGLPGVSESEWKDLLNRLVNWPIVHISIYFLMVHENTPLYFGVKANKITLPCDESIVDLYYWSIEYLALHGFEQYEISNFARSGYQSRHNTVYWQRKPFKAFGLGACSFDGKVRYANEKNLMRYIDTVNRGDDTTIYYEDLTPEQIWLEKLMLGLRQTKGVKLAELIHELPEHKKELFTSNMQWLLEQKLIKVQNGVLTLTPQALAVENEIILKLSV